LSPAILISIVIFVGLSFCFFVPQVFAETTLSTHPQYCGPDSTDKRIFTGIQYEAGAPKITLAVDPDFERDILRGERKITGDIPVTPIYDLVVTIVPTINEYCLSQWDKDGILVEKVNPPTEMGAIGEITMLEDGQRVVVRENREKNFTRVAKNEQGQWVYQWKIKNWSEGIGWFNDPLTDRVVKAISTGQPIEVVIKLSKDNQFGDIYSSQVGMSLCAPTGGSGKYGIVTMRGASANSYNFNRLVLTSDSVRKLGFETIEPFADFRDSFSHYIDLDKHDDGKLSKKVVKINGNQKNTGNSELQDKREYFWDMNFPEAISQCRDARIYIFINELTHLAYTDLESKSIFISTGNKNNSDAPVLLNTTDLVTVIMHEIGHAFAGLSDEYIVKTNLSPAKAFSSGVFGKNCAIDPADAYTYKGRLYGSPEIMGCTLEKLSDSRPVYRPTNESIMNSLLMSANGKFNVVSCGYIIASITGENTGLNALTGENGKQYFEYCKNLTGLADTGINYEFPKSKSGAYELIKNRTNLSSGLSTKDQVSAVLKAGTNLTETGQRNDQRYLIIESFDPQDRWGALIELDKDGNMTGPMIENETTPIPSPTKTPVTSISKSSFARNGIARFFYSIASGVQAVYSNTVKTVTSVIYRPVASPSSSIIATPVPAASPNSNKNTISPSITTKPTVSPSVSFKPAPTTYRSPSPSNMPTITPTPKPSTTIMPTPYRTYAPTPTPVLTNTPAPTPTVAVSVTPIPAMTSLPTPTPTGSVQTTITVTPTPTASPANSPSPTLSVSPTVTPVSSSSPSPTATATPNPSASPGAFLNTDMLKAGVFDALKFIFLSVW